MHYSQFRLFLCVSMWHLHQMRGVGGVRAATVLRIPCLVNSLDQKSYFRKSSWTYRLLYLIVFQRV